MCGANFAGVRAKFLVGGANFPGVRAKFLVGGAKLLEVRAKFNRLRAICCGSGAHFPEVRANYPVPGAKFLVQPWDAILKKRSLLLLKLHKYYLKRLLS